MKILLDEKDMRLIEKLRDPNVDYNERARLSSFCGCDFEGKDIMITLTVDDWAKANMFLATLFNMRKSSKYGDDKQNVSNTGMVFKSINYDSDADNKIRLAEDIIDVFKNQDWLNLERVDGNGNND